LIDTEIKRLLNLEELLCPASTCIICERNIGKSIKVRDMDSADNFVYCLDCHMRGTTKEGLNHKADCDYFIYDSLKWPLISPDWTAERTLRLFQGIIKCGMGNWSDVAAQFVCAKTEAECEELYLGYLYKPGSQ
jgi:transcriptional adapter 2-alpha